MFTVGIDVSKEKIDVFLVDDTATRKAKPRVFKNTETAYIQLMNWAQRHTKVDRESFRFVMEATGIYHEAFANWLYHQSVAVHVVNPARIKAHARSLGVLNKTDKKDSAVIAHYGATMPLRDWHPEPEEIQVLKGLISRYQAIEKDLQREKNRLEKATTGQSSEIILSSINSMITILEKHKAELRKEINRHIDDHPDLKQNRKLLESIPGVGEVISVLMMAVIGSRDFNKAKQCSAFLGLNPIQTDSGSSGYRPSKLSKMGDGKVRAKLYMAAVSAITHNPDIKDQYQRLLRNGKSTMAALGAAMRKLVQICFGVLKHQKKYQQQCT